MILGKVLGLAAMVGGVCFELVLEGCLEGIFDQLFASKAPGMHRLQMAGILALVLIVLLPVFLYFYGFRAQP